jgi:hypothetical protein
LSKSERLETYFKKDHFFGLPKVIVNIVLYTNEKPSVKQALIREIFDNMFLEEKGDIGFLAATALIST